jgi:hypothetical protein
MKLVDSNRIVNDSPFSGALKPHLISAAEPLASRSRLERSEGFRRPTFLHSPQALSDKTFHGRFHNSPNTSSFSTEAADAQQGEEIRSPIPPLLDEPKIPAAAQLGKIVQPLNHHIG